jgi:hypothetical protein
LAQLCSALGNGVGWGEFSERWRPWWYAMTELSISSRASRSSTIRPMSEGAPFTDFQNRRQFWIESAIWIPRDTMLMPLAATLNGSIMRWYREMSLVGSPRDGSRSLTLNQAAAEAVKTDRLSSKGRAGNRRREWDTCNFSKCR